MLKTFMSATAISALMVSGALAQAPAQEPATPPAATQPAPSAPEAPAATPSAPATGTPAAPTAEAPAAAPSGPQFLASQGADQWLASRFRGTDVIGPDNAKVGDVTDILFDQEGKVIAIVVGVGGFLGIGQKDVAIDLAAFEVVPPETRGAGGTAEAPAGGTTGTAAPPPAATGTGAGTGLSAAGITDPNNINLRVAWTREQLDEAPSFERYQAPTPTTGTGPGAPAGGGGMAR